MTPAAAPSKVSAEHNSYVCDKCQWGYAKAHVPQHVCQWGCAKAHMPQHVCQWGYAKAHMPQHTYASGDGPECAANVEWVSYDGQITADAAVRVRVCV